jgi:hypothetical protein
MQNNKFSSSVKNKNVKLSCINKINDKKIKLSRENTHNDNPYDDFDVLKYGKYLVDLHEMSNKNKK